MKTNKVFEAMEFCHKHMPEENQKHMRKFLQKVIKGFKDMDKLKHKNKHD